MRSTYLLPCALLGLGVLGENFVSVTVTRSIIARDTTLPCDLAPTDGTPPFCLVDFDSTTAPPPTTSPNAPAPSCSMQNQDPDQGITSGYCVCDGSKTLPLLTAPATAMATESCAYSSIPGATISPTITLGPATTNSALCEVCTPVVNNEDSCTTIPGCYPQAAAATVQVGSSPIHVGTLTGTALYTSISSALEALCPSVTQTTSLTACSTDTVTINNIDYVSEDSLAQGELVVRVDSSQYNVTSLRDAMINSAALTAQNSATGNNCYNQSYTVEELRKRNPWTLGDSSELASRDRPYPVEEKITLCNAAHFAGVQYYSQFWRTAPQPGATDYIDATWEFTVGPGGDFACEFLQELTDALVIIEPEFAVGEVELGEEVYALCTEAISHT